MKDKKNSLGTGLEALLGKDKNEERERGVVKEIQLNEINPSQYQPRKKMHKETLEELAQSIKQQGVLQPVLVRRQASGSYELVVGERRWRASQVAGLKTIPAIIYSQGSFACSARVTTIAMSIPTAERKLPLRAVAGEPSIFRPKINKMAETT